MNTRQSISIPRAPFLLLALALLLVGAGCWPGTASQSPSPRPIATDDPFRAFIEVRNDCGTCGTASPIGGWENVNGDAMIINDDGTFFISMAGDAGSFGGNWQLDDSRLCFSPDSGEDMCFAYRQKIDAMTLDNAIFIRR